MGVGLQPQVTTTPQHSTYIYHFRSDAAFVVCSRPRRKRWCECFVSSAKSRLSNTKHLFSVRSFFFVIKISFAPFSLFVEYRSKKQNIYISINHPRHPKRTRFYFRSTAKTNNLTLCFFVRAQMARTP